MLEDKRLLLRCRRGDNQALERIYHKYKRDLMGLAVSLPRDRALAEDVVHDVFVSFVKIAPEVRLHSSLKGYLLSSVVNRIRRLARQPDPLDRVINDPVPEDGNGTEPYDCVLTREQSQQIERALQQLPAEQHEVIVLHLYAGLTFRAIARIQGVSASTVRSRYRYGLKQLAPLLDDEVT